MIIKYRSMNKCLKISKNREFNLNFIYYFFLNLENKEISFELKILIKKILVLSFFINKF